MNVFKGEEPQAGAAIWPKPQYMGESSKNVSYLSQEHFEFVSNFKVNCDIIEENIKLYRNILFPPLILINSSISAPEKMLMELNIEIIQNEKCPLYPETNMDESCRNTCFSGDIFELKLDSRFLPNFRRAQDSVERAGQAQVQYCLGSFERFGHVLAADLYRRGQQSKLPKIP